MWENSGSPTCWDVGKRKQAQDFVLLLTELQPMRLAANILSKNEKSKGSGDNSADGKYPTPAEGQYLIVSSSRSIHKMLSLGKLQSNNSDWPTVF